MTATKIFSVDVLNAGLLEQAISLQANVIVSNEKTCEIPARIKYINSEVYRVPGTYKAYAYNNGVISRLFSRFSNKLSINGVSTRKAIAKMVYWTNYKTGYLHACLEEVRKPYEIVHITPYLSGKKLREILKYLKHYASNNIKRLLLANSEHQHDHDGRKIAILVNDGFELGVFEYLIKIIPAEQLVIFHYGNIDFSAYSFIKSEVKKTDLSTIRKYCPQPFINPLHLNREELSVVNILVANWHYLASEIERYKFIASTDVQSIVINVGENLPVRNLMLETFGDKIAVYNTMNGMKSGEAHDGDINFTKWFVWDELMKRLLVEKCGVNEQMLRISGHLMKDFVKEYKFMDTVGVNPANLVDKKVISVFSVRGHREEKVETFKYLYELLAEDSSYFLLVRHHPLENAKDYLMPETPNANVHFVNYDFNNSKQSLYDQISISDIGIVFGSTVAIECQWMNLPVVTFEKRDVSNVYCTDNVSIKHVRSIEELKKLTAQLEKRIKTGVNRDMGSTAGNIMEIIKRDQNI